MSKILSILFISWVYLYSGPICDFKINDIKAQIEYANQKNQHQKVAQLKDFLQDFKNTCKDSDILKNIDQNIQETHNNLIQAKQNLLNAHTEGNSHKIRQAQIDLKVANMQYVAAKQELLRMKDLLKNHKK